jgi:hypothetical protein
MSGALPQHNHRELAATRRAHGRCPGRLAAGTGTARGDCDLDIAWPRWARRPAGVLSDCVRSARPSRYWPLALSTGGYERVARGMTIAGIQPLNGKPWCCHRGLAGNGEPQGGGMADLLETVMERHGGLDR